MVIRSIFAAIFSYLVLSVAASGPAAAASAAELEADAQNTIERFYRHVGGARDLAQKSAAMLIFPSVVKAGMGIGGEYGEGVLFERGQPNAYYNTVSASIGFQLGVQARSVIILFMNRQALASFRRAHGWKVGVDGSIAIITVGAGGSVDSARITNPIVGFILDPKGLMYNLTLEGSKISRIRK